MIKKIIIRFAILLLLFVVVVIVNLVFFVKKSSQISEGEKIERYETQKSALIVLDIQEGTTGAHSLDECYTSVSDDLIKTSNQLIESAKIKDIPVVYIKSEVSNKLVNIINNSMAVGSKGAQLDNRLKVISDLIFPKEKQDAFSNPKLDNYLIENKINKLFIIGLDAAHCVNSTITAAQNRSYRVTVISDALASKSDSLKIKMIEEFKNRNIVVISSSDFL